MAFGKKKRLAVKLNVFREVYFDIDFYRSCSSFMVGIILSLNGSLVQFFMGNVLADVSTLGANALAVLLVLISYLIDGPNKIFFPFFLLVLIFLLFLWSGKKKQTWPLWKKSSPDRILLIGLCFNLLVGAIFSLGHFIFLALNRPFPSSLWYGSVRFTHSYMFFSLVVLLIFNYLFLGPKLISSLEMINLGRRFALGQRVMEFRIAPNIIFISLVNSVVIISFFGVFSFAGVVFPLILRLFSPFRFSLQKEIYGGALFSGFAFFILDFCCYNFPLYGVELPLGLLTILIGPLFLFFYLLKKGKTA